MSHMTENQRMQQERYDLRGPDRSVRVSSARSVAVVTVLGLVILGLLTYAAIQGIDHWWQGLVLGVIVMTSVGLMIAVNPNRRG